jgi:hypothetical protein
VQKTKTTSADSVPPGTADRDGGFVPGCGCFRVCEDEKNHQARHWMMIERREDFNALVMRFVGAA